MHLIIDIEGNNLRETITEIHCIVAKSVNSNIVYRFYNKRLEGVNEKEFDYHLTSKVIRTLFNKCTEITGHNIIGYDIPVLERFFNCNFDKVRINDTYVISYTLFPDRLLPEGCPTSTPNPLTGNKDTIHPHSLEALGWPLGYRKIHHHDWRTFSPEMLERCESDVLITEAVYFNFMSIIDGD